MTREQDLAQREVVCHFEADEAYDICREIEEPAGEAIRQHPSLVCCILLLCEGMECVLLYKRLSGLLQQSSM